MYIMKYKNVIIYCFYFFFHNYVGKQKQIVSKYFNKMPIFITNKKLN